MTGLNGIGSYILYNNCIIFTSPLTENLFQNVDDGLHLFDSVVVDKRDADNRVVDVDLGTE